jgi:hypothetical protein
MPDDRIVACHESGHVLAAHALGQSISTVELTDTGGEFRPFARESWEPVTVEGKQAFRDAVLDSLGPDHLEEMLPTMISLLAGLAAQRRLVGHAHDDYGDSDVRQCEEISRAVAPGGERELLAHARERAESIVASHWHQVEALAAELLLHRQLDAGQIAAIIKEGPAARRRRHWEQLTARAQASGVTLVPRGA